MTATNNAYDLARAFSEALASELTAEQLEQVNERNAAETNHGICHSHDFCDANQTMIDAAKSLGMEDPDPSDEATASLFNRAWSIAKDCGFDAGEISEDEAVGE